MTVPPRFTPHPDDEPQQGEEQSTATPTPNFGSLQPPGGSTYAAPSSPRQVPREEPLPPRQSGALNHFGGYSVTASGLGVLASALMFIGVGVPIWLPILLGLPGIYYGIRGLSAARDGFATNRWMSLTGLILGVVAVVLVPLVLIVFVYALASAIGEMA